MTTTNSEISTWYSKQRAAETIGVSIKTVENLGAQGKIASAIWRRPEGGAQIRVYSPVDVERVAAARQQAGSPQFTITAAQQSVDQGLSKLPNGLPTHLRSKVRNILKASAQLEVPITTKYFLTIPEAAALAGLSETYIRRGCIAGTISAMRDGRVWRIRRSALAEL